MDRIFLEKMEFYGYHGVFPEENRLGQRFVVDLTIDVDLEPAGKSDNLEDSVNYGELYELCRAIVEGERYKLVETIAERIAEDVLAVYQKVGSCTVKVYKPDPPIPGHYKAVAVQIQRRRQI